MVVSIYLKPDKKLQLEANVRVHTACSQVAKVLAVDEARVALRRIDAEGTSLLDGAEELSAAGCAELEVFIRSVEDVIEAHFLSQLDVKTYDELANVRHLRLMRRPVYEIPETFERLLQLEDLDLFKAELSMLPSSIGSMTQLRHIKLRSNQLSALEYFNISKNALGQLPLSFGRLPALKHLEAG